MGYKINPESAELAASARESRTQAAEIGTQEAWLDHLRNVIGMALAAALVDAETLHGVWGPNVKGVALAHDRDDQGGMTMYPADDKGRGVCGLNVRVALSAAPCGCDEEDRAAMPTDMLKNALLSMQGGGKHAFNPVTVLAAVSEVGNLAEQYGSLLAMPADVLAHMREMMTVLHSQLGMPPKELAPVLHQMMLQLGIGQ